MITNVREIFIPEIYRKIPVQVGNSDPATEQLTVLVSSDSAHMSTSPFVHVRFCICVPGPQSRVS